MKIIDKNHWSFWKIRYKFIKPYRNYKHLHFINHLLINGYKFSNN